MSHEMLIGFEEFFASYLETLLWSSNDESDNRGGEPLDQNYCVENIHPDSLKTLREECVSFFRKYSHLIDDRFELAGHDFWLTRNRHGAGFWDGDWGGVGDELTKACSEFNELFPYVGDDNMIHVG